MNYTVGQVVFAILKKEAGVYPVQVVEEITKKTLEGELTTYMVRVGADPQKVVAISDIDGELFDSAEKAKTVLIERVSAAITQRVDSAIAKAKEWYPTGFERSASDGLPLKKPQELLLKKQPVAKRKAEVEQLAAEFAQEAAEESMMEIPDGKGGTMLARVKGVKLPSTMSS